MAQMKKILESEQQCGERARSANQPFDAVANHAIEAPHQMIGV